MENQSVEKSQHPAKTLFWYLAMFLTMAVSAFGIGAIWFQFINKWLPDIANVYEGTINQFALKSSIASLIVAFPAFFLFSMFIRKAIDRGEIALKQGPRQWVGYLTLFLVIAITIGDLIATIIAFLNGDLTTRFLLKALVIFAISGWVFNYFWLSLRSADGLKKSIFPKIALGTTAALVLISIVSGFFLVDSPGTARKKAIDQRRISDLYVIQGQVEGYYARFEALPETLETLDTIQTMPVDPQTGEAYTYEIIDEDEYKLCATFETSNKDASQTDPFYDGRGGFIHDAGFQCTSFKIGVDPYSIKPIPIPVD